MNAGDFLVYGDGRRVEIINFPKVNKQPGVQLRDPEACQYSDNFKPQSEVMKWVDLGVWKIEPQAETDNSVTADLVKALQFYADGKHVKDGIGWDSYPSIEDGEVARAALAKAGAA